MLENLKGNEMLAVSLKGMEFKTACLLLGTTWGIACFENHFQRDVVIGF